mmetsp:Transcript_17640/g.31855  ORF Transcript_17640/g.31855 Transcript_17640/m.31855 type:complete len:104 (+) Transcript_17640:1724-2035(+)
MLRRRCRNVLAHEIASQGSVGRIAKEDFQYRYNRSKDISLDSEIMESNDKRHTAKQARWKMVILIFIDIGEHRHFFSRYSMHSLTYHEYSPLVHSTPIYSRPT